MEKMKQHLPYYPPQDACTVQLISKPRQAAGRKVQGQRRQFQRPPRCASFQPLLQDLALARNGGSGCSHVCRRPSTDPQQHLAISPQVWRIEGKKIAPVLLLREASRKSSEGRKKKKTNNFSVYFVIKESMK